MRQFYYTLIVFIASVFLWILFVIPGSKKHELNINNVKKVQSLIYKNELNALNDITLVKDFLNESKNEKPEFAGLKTLNANAYKEILCFYNDSLVFYTGNRVAVSSIDELPDSTKLLMILKNGYYQVAFDTLGPYKIYCFNLIKYNYEHPNKYLVNEFHPDIHLSPEIEIGLIPSKYSVFSINGDLLFSLKESNKPPSSMPFLYMAFLFYLISFIASLRLVEQLYELFRNKTENWKSLIFLAFIVDMLIVRAAYYFIRVPEVFFKSPIFSSDILSHSSILPNLADTLLSAVLIAYISLKLLLFVLKHRKPIIIPHYIRILLACCFSLLINILIVFFNHNIGQLVFNVKLNISLNNLFDLSFTSFLVIFIITTFFVSNTMIIAACIKFMVRFSKPGFLFICFLCSQFVVLYLFTNVFHVFIINVALTISWGLIALLLASLFFYRSANFGIGSASAIIVFMAAITTFSLNIFNQKKEKESREVFLKLLSQKGDPLIELSYYNVLDQLKSDQEFHNIINSNVLSDDYFLNAENYITNAFKKQLNGQYDVIVTVCQPGKLLNILPENYLINCNKYFSLIIMQRGLATSCEGLFFIDEHTLDKRFIGKPKFETKDSVSFFIELYSKFVPDGLGYPELLVGRGTNLSSFLLKYSYAKYLNGQLVYKFGNYLYSYNLNNYDNNGQIPLAFNRNDYTHYFYSFSNNESIILSVPSVALVNIISPFSYLLILYVFYCFVLLLLAGNLKLSFYSINLRRRLQYSIIGVLVASFLLLGSVSVIYIIILNNKKTENILKEKSNSVLIELEHKLSDYYEISNEMHDYVYEILNKFSTVFFSDINLFSTSGGLIASSRPQIFEEGLISERINKAAFNNLIDEKKLLHIQKERIGYYEYLSAYLPLKNIDNRVIAYLNLPYFAKQEELKDEISIFVTTFINVFILVFVFALLLTILISKYITRPLQLIKEKMSSLKLDQANEKIEWKKEDEIGSLVKEYNRMLDELSESAEILAKTEREYAWREMARQVAHEIKNPLTPMKLSIQHLLRTKDVSSDDWNLRLERTAKMLIEQIDNLSSIAGDFSNFARMPAPVNEKIDLASIINSSLNLYNDIDNVKIDFIYQTERTYSIYADKQLLIRAFNNIIENAIHAGADNIPIEIVVQISELEDVYLVSFTDYGVGIHPENAKHIFSPSFTTKTSGMGLGLAIVKSIINEANAKIYFKSEAGKGTTFYIEFPKCNKEFFNSRQPS